MSKEPTRLVFPDQGPAPATVSSSAASSAGEPRPLVFPGGAASSSPASPPAPSIGSIRFPEPSTAPAASSPGKLTFPAGAPTQPVAAGPEQPSTAPRPIDFSRVPAPPPPAKAPGVPAFISQLHPLHASVVAKARSLADEVLTEANLPRLERMVAELLPLRTEVVENFGALMLDQGREHAVHTAQLTKRYNQLQASELLQRALDVGTPVVGLRQRLRNLVGEDRDTIVLRLRELRQSLADSLKQLRDAQPEARADAERLALLMLALRSTLEVCGTPKDNVLEFAVNQRLDTLRLAATQANLVPAQLKANEQTASLQLAECDRLLNVTFSAAAMAQGKTA